MTFTAIKYAALAGLVTLGGCQAKAPSETPSTLTTQSITQDAYPAFGRITALDPAMANHVALNAKVEKLANGFQWSEGPTWDVKRNQLYFTDVPQNKMFTWSERDGLQTLLDPAGVDPTALSKETLLQENELGINGTWLMPNGRLLIASHGARTVERLDLETLKRETLVDNYRGRKFNSPNDIAMAENLDVYFTDPPYGLKAQDISAQKELDFNGVYRMSAAGELSLIDDSLTRPNGIALSPDERYLYVTNSDVKASKIMRYTAGLNGFANGQVWLDTQVDLDSGLKGNPDGLAVAANGTVYSTGPGGVLVISPEGKLLGRIMIGDDPMGKPTANCTLGGPDGQTLYITSQDTLARVRVKSGQ